MLTLLPAIEQYISETRLCVFEFLKTHRAYCKLAKNWQISYTGACWRQARAQDDNYLWSPAERVADVVLVLVLCFPSASDHTDPVYALLRCAATIRKNSSVEDSSGASSLKSRQNTASFDISNSSRSPSPSQGTTMHLVRVCTAVFMLYPTLIAVKVLSLSPTLFILL